MADPQALRLVHTKDGTGSAGYALVPRHVMTLPVFRNEAEALAFVGMILRASWRYQRVRYKGHVLALQRGQLAVSIRDFARAIDRDKAWVERLWKRLKSEALIETRSEAGVSIITICKYDEYQQPERFHKAEGETLREAVSETVARQLRDTEQSRETIGTKETESSVIALQTPATARGHAGKKVPSPPERQRTSANQATDPFPRPAWADPQVWADFLANRKAKRRPNTTTAYRSLLRTVERLASPEWPPARLLEHAAASGWTAIYQPKEANDHVRGSVQSSSFAPIEFGPALTLEQLRREGVSP